MIFFVTIENFRALNRIELNDLKRVNLISGRNNIGKSTLLEALFLYMDHSSSDSFGKLNSFRGIIGTGVEGLWEPLFHQMNPDTPICISVVDDENKGILRYMRDNNYIPSNINGISEDVLATFRIDTKKAYSLRYTYEDGDYSEEGHFSLNGTSILRDIKTSLPGNELKMMKPTQFQNTFFIRVKANALANEIGNIELAGKKNILIQALQEMDSAIEDIVTLSLKGITQLYIRVSGKLMPLQYAGDGITQLLSICLSIMNQKNGLVLIDELENGLHYSMYSKLWKIIENITRQANCQVIATTHSYELISAVRDGISDTNDFSYYRIGTRADGASAYRYDYSMLDSALESEMEVR